MLLSSTTRPSTEMISSPTRRHSALKPGPPGISAVIVVPSKVSPTVERDTNVRCSSELSYGICWRSTSGRAKNGPRRPRAPC